MWSGQQGKVWRYLWLLQPVGVLVASTEQSPGMLRNILQCMGQSPQQRFTQSKMLVVPRVIQSIEKLID